MSMTLFPLSSEKDISNVPATLPGDAPQLTNSPAESVELGDYVRAALDRWRWIAAAAMLGGLAGLLLTVLQTPMYRAKTSIEIQNINGDFLNIKEARPMSDSPQGTDALLDLQTQIEILQSNVIAQNAIRALQSAKNGKDWQAFPSIAMRLAGRGAKNGALSEAMFDKMEDSRKIRGMGQTRLIQVQADAPNPRLAADFANMLVAEYIRQNIKARWQMTEAAEDLTRSQLADMRAKLKSSEEELQKYAAANGLVFTSERQNISDDRIRQVQSDYLRARSDLTDKQVRRDLAISAKPDTLPDVIGDTDLRELRNRLIDLQRQEAELVTIFKPDYSDVKKVQAQITEVESSIQRERDRVVTRIMNEYTEANNKEGLLQNAYKDAVRRAAVESQVAVQYDVLKRDVDANLGAYQAMLTRVKDLNLAAAVRTGNVRIVDPAEPPERPSSPRLPLNTALGMFSGMTLAVGGALFKERANKNLRHPGEALMRLGVPELGVIPSTGEAARRYDSLRYYQAPPALTAGEQKLDSVEPYRHSPAMDGFRTVLTSIMLSEASEQQRPKVVVVTSSSSQDGKTTVASNLALAFARAGKRVLLIDGDLRCPKIHRLFDVPNARGFGNLLQHCDGPHEAQQAVRATSVPNLSVLPSGSFEAAPADLLFERQLPILLRGYRERYEMVVVDTPPMMGMPDARLLARHADGVILVARANRTTRNSLVMACHRLGQDRSRVLGVVLNDWNGEVSPYPSYNT